MLGEELKLNDTVYYVDEERLTIIDRNIKSMTYERIIHEDFRGLSTRKEGDPDYVIILGFGDSWEKRPRILPDGDNCMSKYSNFPLYTKEEDAKAKLVELIYQKISRLEDEKSRLQDKVSDLL